MHKQFDFLSYTNISKDKYTLVLKRDGEYYKLTSEFPSDYLENCLKEQKISFKDDSWLNKNLKSLKKDQPYI